MYAVDLVNLGFEYVKFRFCVSDVVLYLYGTMQLIASIFLSTNWLPMFRDI